MAKKSAASSKPSPQKAKTVELSMGEGDVAFPWLDTGHRVMRTVEVKSLTQRQRRALRMVFDGLQYARETVNGREIRSQQDAVRWMLEQVAGQIEGSLGARLAC